jgi:hypothetical protein
MAVKAKEQVTVSWIIDIESTTKYYLLQSSTATPPSKPTANPPGGNWKTAEPAYTSGSTNTLYTVDQTLWTNGKVTYSAVCKSSSYEAAKEAWNKAQNAQNTANSANSKIDGLEIGGRNLLTNSKSPRMWVCRYGNNAINVTSWDYVTHTVNGRTLDKAIKVSFKSGSTGDIRLSRLLNYDYDATEYNLNLSNKKYTFSIWLYSDTDITLRMFITRIYKDSDASENKFAIIAGKWTKISMTKTFSSQEDLDGIRIRFTCGTTSNVLFGLAKLEEGNKATDWTPAPEDTDIKIESYVESEIKKEEDSIKLWAGQTYTTKKDFNALSGRTGTLETWKNEASQKITKDGIIATVGSYYTKDSDFQSATTRITNAESRITQLNDSIELKVEKDGIISAINQTSESVTISASKINLAGYVSVSDLKTAGKTTVNGSNVTTGTISADRIDAKSLFAKQLDATNLHVTGKSRIDGGLVTSGINAGNITVGTLSADRIDVTSLFSKKIEATDLHITGKSTFDGVLNGATGTFTGELSGATGTFSGTLSVTRSFSSGDASVIIGVDNTSRAITLKPAGLTTEYGITYDGNAVMDVVTANYFNGNTSHALTLRNNGDPKAAAMTFHWTGKDGQPTWMWGGNDANDMYVYNPSNFSVASAAVSTHMAMPRVGTDVNANGRPALNRAFWREYNSACAYLPDASWYHIFTGQGPDDSCTTQLALGMTTQKVAYRYRFNSKWGYWREIPLLDKNGAFGKVTIVGGLYDTYGNTNTTTNLNQASYVTSNGRIARYASSSKRYKHDIAEIFDVTCTPEALYDLPVVTYRYNDGYCQDEPHGEKLHIGFIAEDVAKLYPVGCGYVNGVPENWNVMEMVPGMLRLIQDQHKDIIKQSTRQDAVESRMNSLQYQLAQAFDRIAALEKENKSLRQALS